MADDIIPLRRSYVQTMVERISELEAEIERLRAAGDELLVCTFASAGRGRVLAARTAWNKEARRG